MYKALYKSIGFTLLLFHSLYATISFYLTIDSDIQCNTSADRQTDIMHYASRGTSIQNVRCEMKKHKK